MHEKRKNKKKRMILLIIGILIVLFIIACSTQEVPRTEPIDFESNNILDFNVEKRNKIKVYSVGGETEEIKATFVVTNISDTDIDSYSVDFAYYDAEGTLICTDSRFQDVALAKGKSARMDTYSELNGVKAKAVKKIKVTNYSYQIGEIETFVDLETKEISQYQEAI